MNSRLWFYLLLAGFLPVILVWTFLRSTGGGEQELVSHLRTQIAIQLRRQAANGATRSHYTGAGHFYIDEQLETLPLLVSECRALQRLLDEEPTAPSRDLASRLQFLQGNRLLFREGGVVQKAGLSETEERLAHPVEVDGTDLREILHRIEGTIEGKPQLLVTDLRLSRKKSATDNETFIADLQLLKREFGQ